MKLLRRNLSLLLAGAFFIGTGAQAQVDNIANIKNYSFQLIDLDTSDGITPTLTITSAISNGISDPCVCGATVGLSDSTAFPTYISTAANYGYTRVWTTGDAIEYNAAARASSGSFNTNTESVLQFTLSANTRLLFSGTASATWYADGKTSGTNEVGSSVMLYSGTTPGSLALVDSYSHVLTSGVLTEWGAYQNKYSENFSVAYENISSSSFNGTLDLLIRTNGNVTTVPEPSSYAMLLIGLLLAGVALRYQRNAP